MRNAQSASLKYLYPVIVRITGISGIVLLIITFLLFPRITNKVELEEEIQIIIEQIDIPQTEQFDRPPPPARPSVPVESESEDIADDVTLEEFTLDEFDAWDAPPPPPEGPRVKFIPYDDPPVPLRPIKPKYPEIAQEAGIEGTVVVQVFVDEKGRVKETVILKGIPNTGLDEAATDAIRIVRFKPAKQRERAVGVWISIPVNFRLKS
jgi:protein TonB|tara:strand:- start:2622 stop:3245 length:624 start_codon:yes stop_codon:yes gene_type:complete